MSSDTTDLRYAMAQLEQIRALPGHDLDCVHRALDAMERCLESAEARDDMASTGEVGAEQEALPDMPAGWWGSVTEAERS